MAATPAVASAARAFLLAALKERCQKPGLVLVSVPAPRLALEPLWAALPDEPAMLWDPPAVRATPDLDHESCLGIGEVADYKNDMPVVRLAPPGQRCGSLRWLGAQPFAERVSTPPWSDRMASPFLIAAGEVGESYHAAHAAAVSASASKVF